MFEQGESSNRQKQLAASFNWFYDHMWCGFCLNTGKLWFVEVSV